MAGIVTNGSVPKHASLSTLQSLNGLFAIYKKEGPTSADVLNSLKEALLKGSQQLLLISVVLVLVTVVANSSWLASCSAVCNCMLC